MLSVIIRVKVRSPSRVNISVTIVRQLMTGVLMICCGGVGVTFTSDQVGHLLNSAGASRIICFDINVRAGKAQ